jgi:D-alanyl-D-alanine carboxypeptidase/D-alanyl-D-alanine-endopeptidase (penicillin-binding protein 4)
LSANRGFRVARSVEDNAFAFHIGELERSRSHRLPFRTDPAFMARLLADTLEALVLTTDYPLPANVRHLRTQALAPIYAEMMQESDNFLAEQFLLMCSDKIHEKLDTDAAIQYVQQKYFHDLSDAPRWVDGSGMSRYNLFTPRSFVEILQKIWRDVPRERIYAQFACGGRSGTLKRRYRSAPAFLYAKTGTLSNNHCLSGFLITRSGRHLAFSFLNNHHRVSSSKIASIMEDVLLEVYRKL